MFLLMAHLKNGPGNGVL